MSSELMRRLQQAGTVLERRGDGRVAVTNGPGVRVSAPNFLSEEFAHWQAQQARNESRDITAADALRRLLDLAGGDTYQCRYAANFLLAWWNAGDCGGWNLTDLWAVDASIAQDMLTVTAFIATNRDYPTSWGLGAEFEALVKQWRPHLLDKAER